MSTYTHDFDLQLGVTPDISSLEGEAEFNTDGQASYTVSLDTDHMTLEQRNAINQLFEAIRRLTVEFTGLTKVEITKKP